LLIGKFAHKLAAAYSMLVLATVTIGLGGMARNSQAQEAPPPSDTGISVDASPQIFAVMCALDAAGFDSQEITPADMPARVALREDLLKLQGPATQALRQFYRDHALASSTETLTPYMTFALVADPPPGFQLPANRDLLPPSVLTIDGFQEIISNFYQEAHLDARWPKIEPESEPVIVGFRAVLRRIVTVSNAYLRELGKPAYGRTFTVYVEPLVGSRANFRNTGDRYAIIVGRLSDSSVDTIQHAYLHYMLDPFVLRYRPVVYTKRALLNVAERAPQLPSEYHDDFVSFMDECLIKAVELRLRHLSGERLEAELKNDDESGFILVRPLVAQLQKFEKDAPAMSYYFPGLITGIDVEAEQKRLQGITFASAEATPALEHGQSEPRQSELEQWVAQGNRQIASKDTEAAAATFQTAFAKYPNDPRVMYGLAITSVLSGEGDRAKELFEQLVSARNSRAPGDNGAPAPDPSIIAWSHVYLGRIHDLEDERELAVNEYQAALAVEGAPEVARVAAQGGVETAYRPPARPGKDQQGQP
jgi:Tetratricopeptide repeat